MNESSEELASLYVLDQLEPSARALAEERLAREPAFAALVRDYEAAFEAGVRALPPRRPSPMVLENLEDRLDHLAAEKIEAFPAAPVAPRRANPWITFAQWGAAAIVTVSLATLALRSVFPGQAQPVFVVVGLDANRNTFAELPTPGVAGKDADARFMQLASTAEDLWRNPAARPLPIATNASAGNHGYAVFDPGSQQGFIAIEQLPALDANQRYHLWVIDESTGRIRDAGILPLTGVNRGLYSFALDPGDNPPGKRTRPNFFITIEDATPAANATAKPRGKVVLGKDSI